MLSSQTGERTKLLWVLSRIILSPTDNSFLISKSRVKNTKSDFHDRYLIWLTALTANKTHGRLNYVYLIRAQEIGTKGIWQKEDFSLYDFLWKGSSSPIGDCCSKSKQVKTLPAVSGMAFYPECPSDRNSSEGFVGHPPSSTGWSAILPQARRTPDTQQMTIRMGRHPGMFCFDTWWTVFPFIIGIHSHITGNFYVSATSNDLSLLGPNDDLQSQLEETAYILRSQDTVWDISQPLNKRWTPKTVKTASQQDVGLSTIVYIYN